jgi:hypothetical protein
VFVNKPLPLGAAAGAGGPGSSSSSAPAVAWRQASAARGTDRARPEEMGGNISAANRPEGGACVEILLPAARLADQPQAEAAN